MTELAHLHELLPGHGVPAAQLVQDQVQVQLLASLQVQLHDGAGIHVRGADGCLKQRHRERHRAARMGLSGHLVGCDSAQARPEQCVWLVLQQQWFRV